MTRSLVATCVLCLLGTGFGPGVALAFDCAAASTDVERAICADPVAKAADDAMSAAYTEALARLTETEAAQLRASQRVFLSRRADRCSVSAPEDMGGCLARLTEARARFLAGQAESGPGPGMALLPFAMSREQSATLCAADVSVLRFPAGTPLAGAAVFNAAVDKAVADLDAEYVAPDDPDLPDFARICTYDLALSVTFASPRVIAARQDFYAYTGGAHGMYGASALIVTLDTGRVPTFSDLFAASAVAPLMQACRDGLIAEKQRRFADVGADGAGLVAEMDAYAETITQAVQDLTRWMIHADRAEVYFGPYEIGSYAEGDYTCALPAALLRRHATGGVWLTD